MYRLSGEERTFLGRNNLLIIFPNTEDLGSGHLQTSWYQLTRYSVQNDEMLLHVWDSPPVEGVLQVVVVVRQLSLGPDHDPLALAVTPSTSPVRLEVGETFEDLSSITDTGDTGPVRITQRLHPEDLQLWAAQFRLK